MTGSSLFKHSPRSALVMDNSNTQAGGFKGIYNGVGAAFLGGVPGAALFFTAYDTTRAELQGRYGESASVDMVASSVGESVACLARVPTENVKQKQQVCHRDGLLVPIVDDSCQLFAGLISWLKSACVPLSVEVWLLLCPHSQACHGNADFVSCCCWFFFLVQPTESFHV